MAVVVGGELVGGELVGGELVGGALVGGALAVVFPASSLAGLSLGIEKNQINAIAGSASKLLGAAGTVWAAR